MEYSRLELCRQVVEYSLPALSHLAVVSILRELYRQAVESIPPESYPRVLESPTHLIHLVPAAQALVVTIPPVLVVHLALALVSTHLALAPESTRPVLASSLVSFPHLEPLSQPGSTQPAPASQPLLKKRSGAVSDIKRENRKGCVDGRYAFALQETDRNRRLSAHRKWENINDNWGFGPLQFFLSRFTLRVHIVGSMNRHR